MRTKTIVGIAVASALSWSYGAMANGYGHMRADSNFRAAAADTTFGVATPYSPNESGPADVPRGDRYASVAQNDTWSTRASFSHEVITPLADNEAGPNDIMLQRRGHRFDTSTTRSMANPQTAWSDNEAGPNTYNEDMRAHRQQVAEVERARIAAAEWNARIAAAPVTAPDTNALSEPVGGTSGVGLQGSNERYVDPSQQSSVNGSLSQPAFTEPAQQSSLPPAPESRPDVRGDAGMPSGVDRTSAMRREPEYSLPVTQYNSVGILETPTAPGEYAVWNVEPLNAGADIATGDTVYVVPGGSEVAIVPEFAPSSPLGASGDQSATSMTDDGNASTESSL
jgi:hypothetical protein